MIKTKFNNDYTEGTVKTFAEWVKATTEGRDIILSKEMEKVLSNQ